jgi:L-asparaginase II
MLACAHTAGWPMFGYERSAHDVQKCCLHSVAHWTGMEADDIGIAVDGCGVVEFAMPLEQMARAYSRLARAATDSAGIPKRVIGAMQSRPFLIGGTDRFDSILIEETDGRVVAKIGAEGVHSVAVLDQGVGIAIKVEDGAQRAQFPAILRLLIRNTRGETVGEIRPVS